MCNHQDENRPTSNLYAETIIFTSQSSMILLKSFIHCSFTLSDQCHKGSATFHICRYINETHWPHCTLGCLPPWGAEAAGRERAGLPMIALFSTVQSLPLIISLFQTSPDVALGDSHAQTHHCFINILSYFLTVGSLCDIFCSL